MDGLIQDRLIVIRSSVENIIATMEHGNRREIVAVEEVAAAGKHDVGMECVMPERIVIIVLKIAVVEAVAEAEAAGGEIRVKERVVPVENIATTIVVNASKTPEGPVIFIVNQFRLFATGVTSINNVTLIRFGTGAAADHPVPVVRWMNAKLTVRVKLNMILVTRANFATFPVAAPNQRLRRGLRRRRRRRRPANSRPPRRLR